MAGRYDYPVERVREAMMYESPDHFPPAEKYGVGPIRDKNGREYHCDGRVYIKPDGSFLSAKASPTSIRSVNNLSINNQFDLGGVYVAGWSL